MSSAASGSGTPVVNSNPACCSIPPVLSDYTPKGAYRPYAGFKRVYITGPKTSDKAILSVFDIFGYVCIRLVSSELSNPPRRFFPQTQQGADILANTMNATVYMPDFFEPDKPFPIDKFPPESDEEKDDLQKFFAGPANPEKAVERAVSVGKALREDGAKFVGAYGMCWGGKVTILAGCEDDPVFDAVAAIHPA